jgi:hypothetical protein
MGLLGLVEINDGLLFFGDLLLQFANLVDDLVQFLLGLQQFSADFA